MRFTRSTRRFERVGVLLIVVGVGLAIGQALLPLPITIGTRVEVDLEQTYHRAALDAYLG